MIVLMYIIVKGIIILFVFDPIETSLLLYINSSNTKRHKKINESWMHVKI
jgi:hypothetical protein